MRVFPLFDSIITDQWTNGWTDGGTNGWTKTYRVECLQLKTWLASHINNFAYLHATKAVLSVVVPICWMVCLSNCQNLLLRHIASLPLPIDKIASALPPMPTHTHLQVFIRFLTNPIWDWHPHKSDMTFFKGLAMVCKETPMIFGISVAGLPKRYIFRLIEGTSIPSS